MEPNAVAAPAACLNCGAPLAGRFCGQCGQKAQPLDVTLAHMAADGWRDVSGYDGRYFRTLSLLVRRPGELTAEILAGRRARYLSPIKLYLITSVIFFIAVAAGPTLESGAPEPLITGGKINLTLGPQDTRVTEEERQLALRNLERQAAWLRRVARPIVMDPDGFKRRYTALLPRAFVGLVPVLAALIALLYRGRPFPQHLTFALNLQAWIFLVLSAGQFSLIVRNELAVNAMAAGLMAYIAVYALKAFRRVYRASWPVVVVKTACLVALYAMAYVATLYAALAWTALV